MGGLLAAGGWIWRYICTFCEALLKMCSVRKSSWISRWTMG